MREREREKKQQMLREKSFEELPQSCTTLQWLPAPLGMREVFAEKGDHITIRTDVF